MPSSATRSRTAPCQSRMARAAFRSKSAEDRDRSTAAPSIRARPAALACHDASARSAAAAASAQQRLQTGLDRYLQVPSAGRLASKGCHQSVPQPAHLLLERAEELPVPTNSCQRASTSPRSSVPSAVCTCTVRTASA